MEKSAAQKLLTTVFKRTALTGSETANTTSSSRKGKYWVEAKLSRRNKRG